MVLRLRSGHAGRGWLLTAVVTPALIGTMIVPTAIAAPAPSTVPSPEPTASASSTPDPADVTQTAGSVGERAETAPAPVLTTPSASASTTTSSASNPVADPAVALPGTVEAESAEKDTSGREAIHVMSFVGSDAIILESNGRFALVDAGEDDAWPDGSDPRYPVRAGTTMYPLGYSARLEAYLQQLGVTPGKVDFFVGTHPHSDHIGYAHDFIEHYKPQRVYTPEYDDSWISDPARLWDNRWVYDRLRQAARDTGATLIQRLDPSAPAEPTGATATGNPVFQFGDMVIELLNYNTDYHRANAIHDANLLGWGVKVTAHGRSAFLAADIEKTDGAEARLAAQIGHVDLLKLAHHGLGTSNSLDYLKALSPSAVVQTGYAEALADEAWQFVRTDDIGWFVTDEVAEAGSPAVVATMTDSSLVIDSGTHDVTIRRRWSGRPRATAYRDGRMVVLDGWRHFRGSYYWFGHSVDASQDHWVRQNGRSYYLQSDATMASTWARIDGYWYKFSSSGAFDSRSGWLAENGRWYYLKSGVAAVGWLALGGTWYYLDPASAAMATGWAHDGRAWYYFDGSGAMRTGWLHAGSTWYYLASSGAMATGWQRLGAAWYYLGDDGAMRTGWFHDGRSWYYADASGAMRTGWLRNGSTWYYLSSSGAMAIGWVWTGGHWYYLDPASGAMATGWRLVDGAWYYMSGSGAMVTGWVWTGSHWYYLSGSGAMVTGWLRSGSTWYYLTGSGAMATGTVTIDGSRSAFAPNGAWLGYI